MVNKPTIKRAGIIILAALLTLSFVMPAVFTLPVYADDKSQRKTVRVGWYESPFNTTDENGRRSGYAYEYQRKIAAYTGWEYEYVEGSWSDLMQMLKDGRIDLMSDVSYTDERAEQMLFSDLPMGTEDYYLYIDKYNKEIKANDLSTLNGKKIGADKGSIQIDLFNEWAREHGIDAKIVELSSSPDTALRMLKSGKIDVYLNMDSYGDPKTNIPVCWIGSSDFYFAVSKDRPDLESELNTAMVSIREEDKYCNQQLSEKYTSTSYANLGLDEEDSAWLKDHGTIRVGYQDNYLAFCAEDSDGELTGALKDYLTLASISIKNEFISFEAVSYPTSADAIEALKNGEVDCMFPANLTDYEGEESGIMMSPPLMNTEMMAVVREAEQQSFVHLERVRVAANEGNPNYDRFVEDHYPGWQIEHYQDTPKCLDAVAAGDADCILISNYRFNNISEQCKKEHLVTVSTGVDMDYCFALRDGDTELYSVLARVTSLIPVSAVNSSLNYYSTEDKNISFAEFVRRYLGVFVILIIIVALSLGLLLQKSVRAERKADAGQRLIDATATDRLTGLYNGNYFFEYAERYSKDHPDHPQDALMINIEQFHFLNELYGREFGDKVLKTLGAAIISFLKETDGIGGRLEADKFVAFCDPQADYQELLDRFQSELGGMSREASIRLRMGVMPWHKGMEPLNMIERARSACNKIRGSEKHLMIFDDIMQNQENLNLRLLNDLGRALSDREFVVYYQPKYDIQCDPPRLTSAEALIRWQHPELGLVAPADFIPLFEGTGQICEIDRYVWEEAARQIALWRDKCGLLIPVSVNLSRLDVMDPSLEETLDGLIEEYGLERRLLKLEITESAYTDNEEKLMSVISRLREKGHEIEMDDFGSGYSSLNMLSSMPVDVLKMDRAFIRNIEHNEKDIRLVELILDIAKNLQVPVIAEGVETEKQMLMLKNAGCAIVQGFFFSRPLPADEFGELITQDTPKSIDSLSFSASHDELTGLYNRLGFDLLKNSVDLSSTALMLIDIDHLSDINEDGGTESGDQALKRVAEVLRHYFRSDDYICRVGEDEFAVLMVNIDRGGGPLIEKKNTQINQDLAKAEPVISVSAGAAMARGAENADEVILEAERALNELKGMTKKTDAPSAKVKWNK